MEHLSTEDREQFLAAHPEWGLEGETITRTFVFDDFVAAIEFVNRIAEAAETADHHPDIDIRWNKVTLALSTHSEGALTTKDTDLAATADALST